MKKERFTVEVEAFESVILKEMEISKADYTAQLKHLKHEAEQGEANPDFYDIFLHDHTTEEAEKVIIERYAFRAGCTTTYMTRFTCKEGYHFKNKH